MLHSFARSEIGYWLVFFKLHDILGLNKANLVACMQVLMRTLARLGADLWDTDALMATTNPGPYILKVLGQDMLGQHCSMWKFSGPPPTMSNCQKVLAILNYLMPCCNSQKPR